MAWYSIGGSERHDHQGKQHSRDPGLSPSWTATSMVRCLTTSFTTWASAVVAMT